MTAGSASGVPPIPFKRALVLWALLCGMMVAVSLDKILLRRFPDPDDIMRLVQVRDLLAGQQWFDLHQYRINPPSGTLMHWSRLVDIPLVLVIGGLTPLLGVGAAENVALVLVPLLTLGVIVMIVAYISSRMFEGDEVTFACLSLGLSPLLVAQVQPMRIDHHGWQIASVMVALLGLLPGRGWRGAALAGAALACGVTISLEVLPILAGFGIVFGFRWLLSNDRLPLPWFLGTLTLASGVLFLATRSLSDLATHCDQISPPHGLSLAVTTLSTMGLAAIAPRKLVYRLVLLGIASMAGIAVFLLAAPECGAGPFSALDPFVREIWYNQVLEGLPVWHIPVTSSVPVVVSGAISLCTLWQLARTSSAEVQRWWIEYFVVALCAFISALLVWRSQAFVGALAAVPLGWLAARLFARLRHSHNWREKTVVLLAMLLALAPGVPPAIARGAAPMLPGELETGEMVRVSDSECDLNESAYILNRLAPATIFAPLDIGPSIIERSHHKVIATGHHRSQSAMREVIVAFTSPAAESETVVRRHHPTYLVLCGDLVEPAVYAQRAPDSLAADLLKGRVPDWLEPVDIGAQPAFRLYRVLN